MSSACRTSIDARSPARATYSRLYRWPESDAAFIQSVAAAAAAAANGGGGSRRRWVPGRPAVVDSYSCRQMYLRSYTFTTEEDKKKATVPQLARRCLAKAATRGRRRREGCVAAAAERLTRLSEASRAAARMLFGRLLSCTTTVDVAGRRPAPPRKSR